MGGHYTRSAKPPQLGGVDCQQFGNGVEQLFVVDGLVQQAVDFKLRHIVRVDEIAVSGAEYHR